jgi:hypothetical protein
MYYIRNLLSNIVRWFMRLFRKTRTIYVPDRPFVANFGTPDRGKEESHTKIRRKMAQKSRRINRLYEQRKGGTR